MLPKVKNILIFVSIGVVLVLVYTFFFRGTGEGGNLVSTINPESSVPTPSTGGEGDAPLGQDFLALFLSVKNIKLDDSIFADPAFATLSDSSIILTQEGNEGRPNPFAPLGSDNVIIPAAFPMFPTGGSTAPTTLPSGSGATAN